MKKAIILSLTLITMPAFGQMVHKCPGPDGKLVYQQTPCPDGTGNPLVIETGKASKSRRATDEEITECIRLIKIVHNFKDPESLKVEGGAYVNEYPSGRKEILFNLNGKNSYGAYAGAKPAYCKYKANGSVDEVKAF